MMLCQARARRQAAEQEAQKRAEEEATKKRAAVAAAQREAKKLEDQRQKRDAEDKRQRENREKKAHEDDTIKTEKEHIEQNEKIDRQKKLDAILAIAKGAVSLIVIYKVRLSVYHFVGF